ncbi:MAG: hypothetical protein QOG66_1620 [Methylobacteriaceae bacterium]|jgi:hypothetical protein|nr:hypothetical protein [Methylobacteriaceae bacterium]
MGVAKEANKQKKQEEHHEKQERLHDALEDSFPASDPPAMTQPTHKSGAPKDKKSTEKTDAKR